MVIEHELGEEIEGAIEYAVGVWTRWLTTYPKRLTSKDDAHTSKIIKKFKYSFPIES
jgi:hypothetical protein